LIMSLFNSTFVLPKFLLSVDATKGLSIVEAAGLTGRHTNCARDC
jgi:hypothetical protein